MSFCLELLRHQPLHIGNELCALSTVYSLSTKSWRPENSLGENILNEDVSKFHQEFDGSQVGGAVCIRRPNSHCKGVLLKTGTSHLLCRVGPSNCVVAVFEDNAIGPIGQFTIYITFKLQFTLQLTTINKSCLDFRM